MPATTVYVAEGAERDGRLREVFRIVAERGIALLEVTKHELDRLTGGAVHQGLAAKIPPYTYAHHADLLDRLVAVPIFGRAESLNLSAAAAVFLYASATAQQAD